MGLFGMSGTYPVNRYYGVQGYFMDFKGGDPTDTAKRIAHLKKINWID